MININLLPTEIKTKISQAKKSADVFSICLVVVFLVVVCGLLLNSLKYMLLQPELDNLKAQVTKATSELKSFDELEKQALFLNDRAALAQKIEAQRPLWSQIIKELNNSVPQTVQFSGLTADVSKSPNFVLTGQTDSEREIIKFKDKLSTSKLFKNVAFKSSAIAPAADPKETSNKIDFSLEFDLAANSLQEAK